MRQAGCRIKAGLDGNINSLVEYGGTNILRNKTCNLTKQQTFTHTPKKQTNKKSEKQTDEMLEGKKFPEK